ncbi:hypothetical protein VTK73DRAFT_2467 [Phialemonium thermophilum]|uniref:Uncharacterized protein n=1 Tax=Phialemonium thermophilum TaxID=223376 RepID=A0ABR3VS26_9PEZI
MPGRACAATRLSTYGVSWRAVAGGEPKVTRKKRRSGTRQAGPLSESPETRKKGAKHTFSLCRPQDVHKSQGRHRPAGRMAGKQNVAHRGIARPAELDLGADGRLQGSGAMEEAGVYIGLEGGELICREHTRATRDTHTHTHTQIKNGREKREVTPTKKGPASRISRFRLTDQSSDTALVPRMATTSSGHDSSWRRCSPVCSACSGQSSRVTTKNLVALVTPSHDAAISSATSKTNPGRWGAGPEAS